MNKITLLIILAVLNLAGCGGGGGSTTAYATATLKIGLSGTVPAGTGIAGAGFTLTLPADVTPAMASGVVAGSVVTPSGTFSGGTLTPPVYTPATATTAGTLKVVLANAGTTGATQAGEVATIVLQLANGVAPTAASFSIAPASVSVFDILGNPISGLQAVVSGATLL